MSESAEIFVRADMPVEHLVRDLEDIVGSELYCFNNDHETWYVFLSPKIRLEVYDRGPLEEDRFYPDFPYKVTIWGINDFDPDASRSQRLEFTAFVFDRLKQLRKYHLVMTDDLEVQLDESKPD